MRRALAVLVVAAALAGCSSSGSGSDDAKLDLSPTTTEAKEASRLPAAALDGFVQADEATLGLDDAAGVSNDTAAEKAELTRDGFVRGVSRSWTNPASNDTVYVALYEFGDDAGAAAYAATQATAIEGAGGIPFGAGGGWTTKEQDGDATLTTHAAVRQEGRWWVLVLVASEVADRTPEEATQLAAKVNLA
jgi:hypothetical protein